MFSKGMEESNNCWSIFHLTSQYMYMPDSRMVGCTLAEVLRMRSYDQYMHRIWNCVSSISCNIWFKWHLSNDWAQQSLFLCSLVRRFPKDNNRKKKLNSYHKLIECSSCSNSHVQSNIRWECSHIIKLIVVSFQQKVY